MTETPYISAKEAAHILGRSQRRINQLVVDGELRAILIGNANAILRESLRRYVAKVSAKSTTNHKPGRRKDHNAKS